MATSITSGMARPTDPPPSLESTLRYKHHSMWRKLIQPKRPKFLPQRMHRQGLSVFYQLFWSNPVRAYKGHWQVAVNPRLWFRMSWRASTEHHAESLEMGFCLLFFGIMIEWNGPDPQTMIDWYKNAFPKEVQ